MKKLMTIGLAAALMFAVAGQVKAAVPLETTGELRVRMFYLKSYAGAVAKNDAFNEFWDQRLRLGMNWQVADSVKLVARADILEGFWGDNTAVTAADAPAKDQIHFDWVNMQFTWPGTPLAFTIGRQDASWGVGILTKLDTRDRFKIVGAFPFGSLVALYQKRKEVFANHDTNSMDDNRQYALAYVGKGGGWSFGVIGIDTIFEADPAVDTQHYIFDGYAMGKAGLADLSFEAFYLTGKSDYAAKADVDLSAFGAYVGAFMPAGPVTIGVEGAYNAGNKPGTANKNEGALAMDYQGPFWSVVLFNNMDLPGYGGETSYPGNTGVSNALAGKLTVVAKPVPALTIVGAAVYATRDKVAAGVKKPMGTELDLIFVYAITPNVSCTVGAGYLITGDYYKSGGKEADNALAATSQFVLKF
jgi:hypothetical protein